MFNIFGLQKRVLDAVQSHLIKHKQDLSLLLTSMSHDIAAKSKQIDKLDADINKRLSFIEHHFAEELAAKEKARQENIKSIRLGHNK